MEAVQTANGKEEQVRYLHVRRPMIGYAMRGMYVPIAAATGGVTVAYQKVGGAYDVAFARCDVRDHYCKALGRSISLQRLNDGDSITVEVSEGESARKVFTDLAYHLGEHRWNLKPAVVWDGNPEA